MTTTIEEDDIDTQAIKISTLVEAAERMVAAGKSVDLSALERKVEALYLAAQSVKPADREGLAQTLAGIIAGLDRLAGDLAKRHRDLGAADAGPGADAKAAAGAYRQSAGRR